MGTPRRLRLLRIRSDMADRPTVGWPFDQKIEYCWFADSREKAAILRCGGRDRSQIEQGTLACLPLSQGNERRSGAFLVRRAQRAMKQYDSALDSLVGPAG